MRNLDLGEECNLSFNTEDGLLCYDWLTCASCWEDSTAQMVCLLEQEGRFLYELFKAFCFHQTSLMHVQLLVSYLVFE